MENYREDKDMKIYYIYTTDNEWRGSIKGYYSSLEKAKEALQYHSNWYRPNGTGEIHEITLDSNEKRLVYENN
jgi:hypothetical protein